MTEPDVTLNSASTKKRNANIFSIFASLVFLIIFIFENINHRFWLNDFRVYYEASNAFLNDTEVYNKLFALQSGYYKYSPFTLLFFVPFTFLNYQAAAIVQFALLSTAIIALFFVCKKIIGKYILKDQIEKPNQWLIFTFLACTNHFIRELHLGNINVLLLLALCTALLCILENRYIAAGMLIALAVITKPFLALILLPLLIRRKFKTIFIFGIAMLWFVASPALLIGVSRNINLHQQWLNTMLLHNSGFPSYNTIESILSTYVNTAFFSHAAGYILIFFTVLIVAMIAMNLFNEQRSSTDLSTENFIQEWFIILALIPNLFKTDTQHFLLSLPIILTLIGQLHLQKNIKAAIPIILILILYGINSTDILGHQLSGKYEQYGILGISNLVLVALFAFKSNMKNEA